MGITTSIFDQATIALMKTYLGTDEKEDAVPSLSVTYDVRAQDFNRILAGLAEVAFRCRYGMMVALQFSHPNVAASQTDLEIYRGSGGDTALLRTVAPFPGSVVGLAVRVENARTAGTLTVEWAKAGVGQTLAVVIDDDPTQKGYSVQLPQTETFVAGDELGVVITTDGSWAAGATPSVDVDLLVSYNDE